MDLDYYTAILYKQFCGARGYSCDFKKIITSDDKKLIKEFKKWIKNIPVKDYCDFLETLNYHNLDRAIEINKGKSDTISMYRPMCTVSPFNYTLGKENSKLHIIDGIVMIEEKRKLYLPEEKKVLIIHNPYDDSILKWPMIQKKGEHDISIGFYGEFSDENMQEKVSLAKLLLKNMNSECELDYVTDKNNFFISLNSRQRIKQLRLHK